MNEQMLSLLQGLGMILAAVAMLVWAVFFVMKSAAIYTIARRRGIRCPYLAWFPVLRQCILGAQTDQYLYLTRGRNRHYRVILPIADFLWRLSGSFLLTVLWKLLVDQVPLDRFLGTLGFVAVLPVVHFLCQMLAKYWLLRSCGGKDGLLAFLLATIIPGAEPGVLLWYCRSDRGMPPKKTESADG